MRVRDVRGGSVDTTNDEGDAGRGGGDVVVLEEIRTDTSDMHAGLHGRGEDGEGSVADADGSPSAATKMVLGGLLARKEKSKGSQTVAKEVKEREPRERDGGW
jgi:hypothetical protein